MVILTNLDNPFKIPTMEYRHLHKWNVTVKEAFDIQRLLSRDISCNVRKLKNPQRIAGVDVSFSGERCCAAVCIFNFHDQVILEQRTALMKISFPYIPTLLTFREGPVILKCFHQIKIKPDVILFDGQGIAHPRKMGVATHLGMWLDLPSIGCAKTHLYGHYSIPALCRGSHSFIKDGDKVIGAVVRTRDRTRPVFVSVGYKITLEESIKIVLDSCTKYRIPEPLRAAHTLSKAALIQIT